MLAFRIVEFTGTEPCEQETCGFSTYEIEIKERRILYTNGTKIPHDVAVKLRRKP